MYNNWATFTIKIFCFFLQNKLNAPPLEVSAQTATVKFENVRFGYSSTKDVLTELSFTVPAGKKIAIVGGSGSG